MKSHFSRSAFVLYVLVPSFSALSANAAESKPCKEIKAACEAGGFVKGAHKEGKGLYKDCLKKIIGGETVAGVTVAPELIAACKAKKGKHGSPKSEKPAD